MADELYYDPYDFEIDVDPYPVWKRMRDEAPLYYNEKYDFFAVSRFDDVERCSVDWRTYLSGRGSVLEMIKRVSRSRPAASSSRTRPRTTSTGRCCRGCSRPGASPRSNRRCGRSAPPASIRSSAPAASTSSATSARRCRCAPSACCSGIPEEDQEAIRDQHRRRHAARTRARHRTRTTRRWSPSGDVFADYIDWRAEHPSDDLMTELLNAEFEDHTGVTRTLSREEILGYVGLLAGAGNETTTRLIGWTGKVLAENPDQRRKVVEDRSLVPNAVEELLRLRGAVTGAGAVHPAGRRAPRAEDRGRQRDGAAHRGGQPRRAPLPRRRALRHRARDRPPPVVRLRHPLLPRRRAGAARGPRSRSTRCSTASPSGTSTGSAPSRRTPAPCAAGRSSRC